MSASLNSQHSTLNWPSPSPRLHPRMWHRHPADEYMGWKPMPLFKDWPNWEVVSSYSSATAPDSHGISCADPLFQARKELDREVAARARHCKNYFRFILSVCPRTSDRVQQLSHRLKAFPLAWRKLEESRRGFRPQ